MKFNWGKDYMPRSLYLRAALILLVPVVTLQLVVSVVFIQRHFAGVTDQMTQNVALELAYLRDTAEQAASLDSARQALAAVADPLELNVILPDDPPRRNARWFYDFSGRQMIRTLDDRMEGFLAADLRSSSRSVTLWLDTAFGPMRATFDRHRVSASNPHQLLVLMLVTGALMTLISYLFLRNQLRPIRRLAHAATEFGRGRVVPYKPSGALEVRAAGNAFLDMRARIERQIEQRTMMLSGVSHDMRTPLTRIKLGLSMLDDEAEAEAMKGDVADMERLLDEFLAFARDETLDDAVQTDPVQLVRGLVDRYRASGAEVTLAEVDVEGRGTVTLRPMAVSRALENLIGNALRYGTRCELRIRLSEKAARISVEDDGPGIPAALREQALKAFSRLDPARNQNRGSGVGLGLAIARDIARRHGGALVLDDSETLGGLRVDLVLPR